jgi:hypothetical protein
MLNWPKNASFTSVKAEAKKTRRFITFEVTCDKAASKISIGKKIGKAISLTGCEGP